MRISVQSIQTVISWHNFIIIGMVSSKYISVTITTSELRAVNFANRPSFLLTTLLALKHQHVRGRIVELTEVNDAKELSSYFILVRLVSV